MRESLEKVYDRTVSEGKILKLNRIELDKIKNVYHKTNMSLQFIRNIIKQTNKNNIDWDGIYTLHYDVLRKVIDAFVGFDKVKILNHQGLFVYLCVVHPELELDWNFFEKIRTVRNGIEYYGKTVTMKDYKEVDVFMDVVIKLIEKTIKERLDKE